MSRKVIRDGGRAMSEESCRTDLMVCRGILLRMKTVILRLDYMSVSEESSKGCFFDVFGEV